MEEENSDITIAATYLGHFRDECSNIVTERVYSMPTEIDGRQVVAYISVKKEQQLGKYSRGGSISNIRVLGWYDLDDPICGDEFKRRSYDKYFTKPNRRKLYEPGTGERKEKINLLDVRTPLPFEYTAREDDTPFMRRFKEVSQGISNQLFNQKKSYILLSRKDSFLEELKKANRNPQQELKSMFAGFNEQEKEKARYLYDRMILCLVKGKYSYEDFCSFMDGLPNVVRGKGLFLSREEQKKLSDGKTPTMVSTFYSPSDSAIANISPNAYDLGSKAKMEVYRKRVIDINHGTSALTYFQLGELGNSEKER